MTDKPFKVITQFWACGTKEVKKGIINQFDMMNLFLFLREVICM